MGKIFSALEKSGHQFQEETSDLEKADNLDKGLPKKNYNASLKPTDQKTAVNNVKFENSEANLHSSLDTILRPQSVVAEQFRLLKNNILFPETGYPPRSIMVTSPSPNEGKSFVASNLALSIAQSIDEFVLLMDCDLRSPTIHKLFGLAESQGLSEHLSNARPLSSLLRKTFLDKLTILPAGAIPNNPSELLSSEQMRRLIQEVTLRYPDRYIIIDAPPPYLTSEASALARQVDGIILVIKHGKTQMKDVENILEIYGKTKILGIVQNFAKKRLGYGHGYYKYGYAGQTS